MSPLLLVLSSAAASQATPALINDTISRQSERIRHCYVRARLQDPELSGKLVVTFTIRSGTAQDIALERDDFGDEALSSCVRDIFWLMAFAIPEASTQEIAVRYPIRLVPEED